MRRYRRKQLGLRVNKILWHQGGEFEWPQPLSMLLCPSQPLSLLLCPSLTRSCPHPCFCHCCCPLLSILVFIAIVLSVPVPVIYCLCPESCYHDLSLSLSSSLLLFPFLSMSLSLSRFCQCPVYMSLFLGFTSRYCPLFLLIFPTPLLFLC